MLRQTCRLGSQRALHIRAGLAGIFGLPCGHSPNSQPAHGAYKAVSCRMLWCAPTQVLICSRWSYVRTSYGRTYSMPHAVFVGWRFVLTDSRTRCNFADRSLRTALATLGGYSPLRLPKHAPLRVACSGKRVGSHLRAPHYLRADPMRGAPLPPSDSPRGLRACRYSPRPLCVLVVTACGMRRVHRGRGS